MDDQKRKLSVDSGDDPNSGPNQTDFRRQNAYQTNPANRLNHAESNPTESPEGDPKKREEEGEKSPWKNKTEEEKTTSRDKTEEADVQDNKKKKGAGWLKKSGPLALIGGGGLGITAIMGMLFSPAGLLINIKETMIGKFNYQSSSMEIRSNRLMIGKTKITAEFCGGGVNVLCRFSSMSDKQVKKLAKAGITVKSADPGAFGRVKPKSFDFGELGGEIEAKDLNKFLKNNDSARKALRKGYNSRFASFADDIWEKAKSKLRLKGKGKVTLAGDGDDAKLKSMQDQTKLDGDDGIAGKAKKVNEVDETDADGNSSKVLKDQDGNPIGQDGQNASAKDLSDLDDIPDGAKGADDILGSQDVKDLLDGKKNEVDIGDSLKGIGGKALKTVGFLDDVCDIYNTIRAIGFAAKTVRTIQLAKYAMVFLNIADQIKAGENPNPDDLEYLGNVLTKEAVATTTKIAVRSATDSFGYKYAAYGDSHKSLMSDFTSQFLAGGGLAGDIIYITNLFKNKAYFDQCKTVSNPWVSVASLAGSIALALIPSPGAPVAWGALIAQFAKGLTIGAVQMVIKAILPSLLADIIAGKLVGEGTFGELAGDAITSGAGVLNGTLAQNRGLAPLTPNQAAAYQQSMIATEEMYAREERIGRSPFDITSPYTFLGKIVFNLTPHMAKIRTPANLLSSVTAVATNSLKIASNLAIVRASSEEEFTQCDDMDYEEMGVATDPFCNIVYGIPPDTLNENNLTPMQVAQYMVDNGHINSETGEPIENSGYAKYLDICINRQTPLGYRGDDGTGDDGQTCIFEKGGDSQKYFYLYHIDNTIDKGMSGEDETLNRATDYGFISFYDPVDDYENVADQQSTEEELLLENIDFDVEKEIVEKLAQKPVFIPCTPTDPKKDILSSSLAWLSTRQSFNHFKQELI